MEVESERKSGREQDSERARERKDCGMEERAVKRKESGQEMRADKKVKKRDRVTKKIERVRGERAVKKAGEWESGQEGKGTRD